VDEKKFDKYILRLLKDKNCKFKLFEKEKDLDIYNFFLPYIRNYMFPTFELRKEKLKDFNDLSLEMKSKVIAKHDMSCFEYYLDDNVQGKMGEEDGIFFDVEKIEIICFNTGICFLSLKTHIGGTEDFNDMLDFNYRFKTLCSEFSGLRDYEKIKIQTNAFKEIKDIKEFTQMITGVSKRKNILEDESLTDSQFYNYSYVCIESDKWNEKNEFLSIENEFLKYANVLPSTYASDYDKENIEQNLYIIEKMKYSKTAVTKSNCNLFCSGIDPYNYTKLPFQYENEYFYTYILVLYKKLFLKKINSQFKNYDKITKMRIDFIQFTKSLWEKEITLDDTGTLYYKTLEKTLELEELYEEIRTKYEIVYKDLNIEKNNVYYSIIVILLIFSLIFNTINIIFLMYLLS
jgi:hypothetical protein